MFKSLDVGRIAVQLLISILLISIGAFFILVAGLGLVRMPDLFLRMSASTKAARLRTAISASISQTMVEGLTATKPGHSTTARSVQTLQGLEVEGLGATSVVRLVIV